MEEPTAETGRLNPSAANSRANFWTPHATRSVGRNRELFRNADGEMIGLAGTGNAGNNQYNRALGKRNQITMEAGAVIEGAPLPPTDRWGNRFTFRSMRDD